MSDFLHLLLRESKDEQPMAIVNTQLTLFINHMCQAFPLPHASEHILCTQFLAKTYWVDAVLEDVIVLSACFLCL